MGRNPIIFTVQEIFDALREVGVDDDMTQKIHIALLRVFLSKPLGRGRPKEKDDDDLYPPMLYWIAAGLTPWAAAGKVTEHLEEPNRRNARRRLCRRHGLNV